MQWMKRAIPGSYRAEQDEDQTWPLASHVPLMMSRGNGPTSWHLRRTAMLGNLSLWISELLYEIRSWRLPTMNAYVQCPALHSFICIQRHLFPLAFFLAVQHSCIFYVSTQIGIYTHRKEETVLSFLGNPFYTAHSTTSRHINPQQINDCVLPFNTVTCHSFFVGAGKNKCPVKQQ